MAYELILQNITRYIRLTGEETGFFLSLLQYRQLRKKEILLREGEISRYENFVLRGCLKAYTVDEKGVEHVILFAPEDWWVSDLHSFLTETPATIRIEAIEDSEILQLSKSDLETLYERVPKFERFFRIMLQNALVAQFQRIEQNLSLTGEEKYLRFRKKYPQLEERLPLKQIASFLGITPEFLSMIRKKLLIK